MPFLSYPEYWWLLDNIFPPGIPYIQYSIISFIDSNVDVDFVGKGTTRPLPW